MARMGAHTGPAVTHRAYFFLVKDDYIQFSSWDFAVSCYLPKNAPHTSFGGGDGKVAPRSRGNGVTHGIADSRHRGVALLVRGIRQSEG